VLPGKTLPLVRKKVG